VKKQPNLSTSEMTSPLRKQQPLKPLTDILQVEQRELVNSSPRNFSF